MIDVELTFQNRSLVVKEVYVEPWPHRFRLQPEEALTLRFRKRIDITDEAHIELVDDAIVIFPEFDDDGIVMEIDGKPADSRSWVD